MINAKDGLTETEVRWLACLDAYISERGDAKVPYAFRSAGGSNLGHWLARTRYHARYGRVSEPLARALVERGVEFGSPRFDWARWLAELQRFADAHGHTDVPGPYVTPEGYRLGKWLKNTQQDNRTGKRPLSAERQAQLRAVGVTQMTLGPPPHIPVDEWLDRLDRYNAGTLGPAKRSSLQDWLWKRRADFQAGTLDPDLAKELTERGVDLTLVPGEDAHLDSWLAHLDEFIATHGHTKVPAKHRTPVGGHNLYLWIARQRKKCREGTLSERAARELVRREVRLK